MKKYGILCLLLLMGCGEVGPQGPAGASGLSGNDGSSDQLTITRFTSDTSVCTSGSGILLQSRNSSAVVCDGTNGSNGQNGVDAVQSVYEITEILDPCGDAIGIYDEVLLKTASGKIIASFSDNTNGQNTRFSVIPPGNYITTDGSNCHFTVNANGTIS